MGNLATNNVFRWTDEDQRVSRSMKSYFANFIKTGNPNGPGLVQWRQRSASHGAADGIDANAHVEDDTRRARYLFLDAIYMK